MKIPWVLKTKIGTIIHLFYLTAQHLLIYSDGDCGKNYREIMDKILFAKFYLSTGGGIYDWEGRGI